MDNLPNEITDIILSNLYVGDIKRLYRKRRVNKYFKKHIDNIKCLKTINIRNFQYENIFNRLSYIGLYCNFKWLFNNNIHLSINNINNLIIHKRYDILELLVTYEPLKNVLFNRFNLFNYKDELDILSISKSDNPLIIAGSSFDKKESNLDIIKVLLNPNIIGNPYIHQISGLFEICVKYNNLIVIKYLIINYYSEIEHLKYKLTSLLSKSNNNIDDIFYYLIQNNKYEINDQFLITCVKKKYDDLFIYAIQKSNNNYNIKYLIDYIIDYNNLYIFKFILKYDYDVINFKYIINSLINETDKKDFIDILLDCYIDDIDKESFIIHLCLLNEYDNNTVIKLINNNYKITMDDIGIAYNNKNIILVEHLSKKFNSI